MSIRSFYEGSRRAGHTQLMLDGLAAWIKANRGKRVAVIAGTEASANDLKLRLRHALDLIGIGVAINDVKFVSISNTTALTGLQAPAAVDNYAVMSLIDRYENQIKLLHEVNAASAQQHIKDLSAELVDTRWQLAAQTRRADDHALAVSNRDVRIAELEAKLKQVAETTTELDSMIDGMLHGGGK